MLGPTSSSATARSLWRISTPLARATTGSASSAKTAALGTATSAARNAASASARSNLVPGAWTTGGQVEAMKRGPLAGRRFAGVMLADGLKKLIGPGFGADSRPIVTPWQRQNRAAA